MLRLKITDEQQNTIVEPIDSFKIKTEENALSLQIKTMNNYVIAYRIQTDTKHRNVRRIQNTIVKKFDRCSKNGMVFDIYEDTEKKRISLGKVGFRRANDFWAVRVM